MPYTRASATSRSVRFRMFSMSASVRSSRSFMSASSRSSEVDGFGAAAGSGCAAGSAWGSGSVCGWMSLSFMRPGYQGRCGKNQAGPARIRQPPSSLLTTLEV